MASPPEVLLYTAASFSAAPLPLSKQRLQNWQTRTCSFFHEEQAARDESMCLLKLFCKDRFWIQGSIHNAFSKQCMNQIWPFAATKARSYIWSQYSDADWDLIQQQQSPGFQTTPAQFLKAKSASNDSCSARRRYCSLHFCQKNCASESSSRYLLQGSVKGDPTIKTKEFYKLPVENSISVWDIHVSIIPHANTELTGLYVVARNTMLSYVIAT